MAKLPDLTPEQLEKIQRLRGKRQSGAEVSPEMYFLAEFGYYLGWNAVVALETGVISVKKAIRLIEAMQKVRYAHLYDQALATFYANKDSKTFNKGMESFLSSTETDK